MLPFDTNRTFGYLVEGVSTRLDPEGWTVETKSTAVLQYCSTAVRPATVFVSVIRDIEENNFICMDSCFNVRQKVSLIIQDTGRRIAKASESRTTLSSCQTYRQLYFLRLP